MCICRFTWNTCREEYCALFSRVTLTNSILNNLIGQCNAASEAKPRGGKSQQIILLLLLLSCWRCTVLAQVSNRQLAVFEEILVPKSNLNIKIWGDKLDFENYPISQRKLHPYFPVISFTWTQTIMVINNLCVKQRERGCFYPKRRIGKSIKATGSETRR